jgi:hypothetical protein
MNILPDAEWKDRFPALEFGSHCINRLFFCCYI